MADHDRIEGAAKNIGGKIKEGAGKMTGDTPAPSRRYACASAS